MDARLIVKGMGSASGASLVFWSCQEDGYPVSCVEDMGEKKVVLSSYF